MSIDFVEFISIMNLGSENTHKVKVYGEKLNLASHSEATVLTANTNSSPINHIHPGILLQGSQNSQNVTNGSLKSCDGTFGS